MTMNRTSISKTFIGIVTLLASASAMAQNMEAALDAFQKKKDYTASAVAFYSVVRLSEDEGEVAEAQYGLARSFEELNLPLAAFTNYAAIVDSGNSHPRFEQALEGLINTGEKVEDDLKMPQILDKAYSGPNLESIKKMSPETLQRLHFHLGRFVYIKQNMKEARQLFGTVKEGNPAYPFAQYMLGLIRLNVGAPADVVKEPKYDKAIEAFENARKAIPADTTDEKLIELRDLSSLAIARTWYQKGMPLDDGPEKKELIGKAVANFQQVPRYSPLWSETLFGRAWAHTVDGSGNQYGRALGALHSLDAPYFADEFYPEAKILKAIVYYYNCQWDRVNTILTETKSSYEPMSEQMKALVEKNLDFDEWYPLLQKSLTQEDGKNDENLLPRAVARAISRDPKVAKMEGYLREIDRERSVFQKNKAFSKSDMGSSLVENFDSMNESYLNFMGKFLKLKVAEQAAEIDSITERAAIISLETKTAEAEWLEQGRETENQVRRRLPRPYIPDDTFQFWWFRNEFWIDELGYYEYTIKTECFEEGAPEG
jgi:tetratricopeptide (TPR) repeat protein